MSAMVHERRASPRHRTLKAGLIVFNGGRSTINCTVRNLSPAGALLRVNSILAVPAEFQLQAGEEVRPARVTRKSATELAVAFNG